jgi:hypothetical protein
MSYSSTSSGQSLQRERQQEKLRIARAALARVEQKYAKKLPLKQRTERHDGTGARRPRAER